ncbi:MAG: hypothetical protein LUP91_05895 [Methylococcaceae bacterium]|nr:hypothetical protein [Methylococcaceae bacterium]
MNNLILALSIFLLVQEINYRGFDLGFSGVYHSPLNDREHHPRFLDTAGDYLIAGVLPFMEGNFERKKNSRPGRPFDWSDFRIKTKHYSFARVIISMTNCLSV